MEIKKAEFVISAARLEQCPKDGKAEFAFIGRSNVGKSSLINMLTGRKGLAKTSATPGKTLLINHFGITSAKGDSARLEDTLARATPKKQDQTTQTPKKQDQTTQNQTTQNQTTQNQTTQNQTTQNQKPKTKNQDEWYIVDLPGYGFAKRSKKVQDDIDRMIDSYMLQREELVNVFLLIDIRHDPQKIDREFMDWLGENGVPFSIVFTKADKLGPVRARQNAAKYLATLADTWEELPPHFITSSEKRQGRDEILNYIDEILAATAEED